MALGKNKYNPLSGKFDVRVTEEEIEQAVNVPKNILTFPSGAFTATPVNDSASGDDGAVYYFEPNADVTLPPLSTMDVPNGIYRVRVATDWMARSTALPAPNWITNGAEGLDVAGGWPTEGSEAVDIVADVANNQWLVLKGGVGNITIDLPIETVISEATTTAGTADFAFNVATTVNSKTLRYVSLQVSDGTEYYSLGYNDETATYTFKMNYATGNGVITNRIGAMEGAVDFKIISYYS